MQRSRMLRGLILTEIREDRANLQRRMSNAVFAFRGYDQTNLGRTPELLAHPEFGPIVEEYLHKASVVATQAMDRPVDLVERVTNRRETGLESYGDAIALIIATELAQLELLDEFFGIPYESASVAAGYSLGEVSALVAGGVYELETVLEPLLVLAADTVELAHEGHMGVLFSRGPQLDFDAVKRHCIRISNEGAGTVAVSSYLSPNTALLIGQGDTIQRFKKSMKDALPNKAHMRLNPHLWPPIHTPIVRQKNIPNRAAVMLEKARGGFVEPTVPILSCVTGGDHFYNDHNSRELLIRWIDNPMRLWDVIEKILNRGIETVIHVGPAPNIIPATLNRLINNVTTQVSGSSLSSIGLRAMSAIVRRPRPWLESVLSRDAALLRAPFLTQVVLEDWLLDESLQESTPLPAEETADA